MGKPEAVIFDMDGVLVDSEPLHVENEKQMFKILNLEVTDEEHAGYMGVATDMMWKEIIAKRNLNWKLDDLIRFSTDHCIPFFKALEKIDPMPGVVELLENLIVKKIPYALASSSDLEIIQIIMEKSGLKKYFRHIVSSSQVGKSKPAPDVFLHTANLLEIDPKKCVVIEDSRNGIAAAKAAGMYCIAYSGAHSGHQDQSMADRQISHFDELIDIETWLKSV